MDANELENLLDENLTTGDTVSEEPIDDRIILTITESNRKISYSGSLLLGVENDYKAEKIYFKSPKQVSDDIDLSLDTVEISIKYTNANNETYIHQCSKEESISEDTVMFSWLLTRNVTARKGNVKFIVCAKNIIDNKIVNEWHTTTFNGEVLEGVVVTDETPEIITDETLSIYQLTQMVESAVKNVNDSLSSKSDKTYVDQLVGEAINDHNDDYSNLDEKINSTNNALMGVNQVATKAFHSVEVFANELHFKDLDGLESHIAVPAKFVHYNRYTGALDKDDGYAVDLSHPMALYDELMIIVRIDQPAYATRVGMSATATNQKTDYLCSLVVESTAYFKITLNKTYDGNYAWSMLCNHESLCTFAWSSSETYKYLKFVTDVEGNNQGNITVVCYGR